MTVSAWKTFRSGNWSWHEGHRLTGDIQTNLQARVYDPLWLLARQMQMGEFYGEDAGSPILVEVESESFPIDRLHLGNQTLAYTPSQAPLEALVEQETHTQAPPDLRDRAQGGLLLLQQLVLAGLPSDRSHLLGQFPFPSSDLDEWQTGDLATRLLAQRAPDGQQIFQAFPANQPISDHQLSTLFPRADASLYDTYRQVITTWREAYEAQVGQPNRGETWREDRLEYQFGLSLPTDVGRVELRAGEYVGGRLDWETFVISAIDTADTNHQSVINRETLLPSPITFPGMPAPRWWEMEDSSVDFGTPDASDRDLGRLLLAEFVMNWGNDWFQIPVEIPTGSLCRINQLLVTDTFGVKTRILSQQEHSAAWAMNYLSQTVETPNFAQWLFVPPTLPISHQAAPLETVLFLRDELANLAWGIETVIPDPLGHPQAITTGTINHSSAAAHPENDEPTYQVITDLPEHWIPLVPQRQSMGSTFTRFLVRAGLLDEMEITAAEPQGRILASEQALRIYDEEIPRSGAQVNRAYQLVRWHNGQRTQWVGRQKRYGIGEIRSHLEFDHLFNPAGRIPSPPPELTAISPSSAVPGEQLTVIITGQHLAATREILFSGVGLTVDNFQVLDDETLQLQLSINSSTLPGDRTVQLISPENILKSLDYGVSFTVVEIEPPPDDSYSFGTRNAIGGDML